MRRRQSLLLLLIVLVVALPLLLHLSTSQYEVEPPPQQPPATSRKEPDVTVKTALSRPLDESSLPAPSCIHLALHENVTAHFRSISLCLSNSPTTAGGPTRPKWCRRGGVIRIALSQQTCEGSRSDQRFLSRNHSLNRELRNHGAHLFRARFDGPETHSRWSKMVKAAAPSSPSVGDSCAYEIEVPSIYAPGQYRLGLEWLYDRYFALDELTNHWPPLKKQSLLPVDPTFATKYHRQQCTIPSTVTFDCEGENESQENGNDSSPAAVEVVPFCNGHERNTEGRWVLDREAIAKGQTFVTTRVRVRKIQRNPIVFEWALQSEAPRRWLPSECRLSFHAPLKELSLDRALPKVAPRVVVGGDSQLRALYFGMANYLTGHDATCTRNLSSVEAEPSHCVANVKGSHRKLLGGVQLDFVVDTFLDRFASSNRYDDYTVVVVGFAQHPASAEHWSFDKFRGRADQRLAKAVALRKKGVTVVWYLAPYYPHTTNGFPVVVKDWRTDARIRLFNDYTKKRCQDLGIPVVDPMSISAAFTHTSPDQAHFTNFVATEFVRTVWTVICSQFDDCRMAMS